MLPSTSKFVQLVSLFDKVTKKLILVSFGRLSNGQLQIKNYFKKKTKSAQNFFHFAIPVDRLGFKIIFLCWSF